MQAVANLLHLTTFHIGQMVFMDYQETDINRNIETYLDMFSKCMDIIKYGVYEKCLKPPNKVYKKAGTKTTYRIREGLHYDLERRV